jgi:hypothetical protein
VWRVRPLALLALVLLFAGGALLILSVGSPSASAAPSSAHSPWNAAPADCPLHYRPLTCNVPQGPSIDPCALLTADLEHCPIATPDFNPADWAGWMACSIKAEATVIFNSIVSDIGNFVGNQIKGVLDAAWNPVANVLNTVSGDFRGLVAQVEVDVQLFFFDLNGTLAPFGPLAPVLVVLISLGFIAAAFVATYYFVWFLVAFAKTLFNLL